jgi:hypothetical protein
LKFQRLKSSLASIPLQLASSKADISQSTLQQVAVNRSGESLVFPKPNQLPAGMDFRNLLYLAGFAWNRRYTVS